MVGSGLKQGFRKSDESRSPVRFRAKVSAWMAIQCDMREMGWLKELRIPDAIYLRWSKAIRESFQELTAG